MAEYWRQINESKKQYKSKNEPRPYTVSSSVGKIGNQAALQLYSLDRTYGYAVSDDKSIICFEDYPHYFVAGLEKMNQGNAAMNGDIRLVQSDFAPFFVPDDIMRNKISITAEYNGRQADNMKAISDCAAFTSLATGTVTPNVKGRGGTIRPGGDFTEREPALNAAFFDAPKRLVENHLGIIKQSSHLRLLICKHVKFEGELAEANEIFAEALTLEDAQSNLPTELKSSIMEYWKGIDHKQAVEALTLTNKDFIKIANQSAIFSEVLSINEYAHADPGEALEILFDPDGGNPYRYHWAGVVANSDDHAEQITIENFAIDGGEQHGIPVPQVNKKWKFSMIGTKKGQTFHERYGSSMGKDSITLARTPHPPTS